LKLHGHNSEIYLTNS